MAANFFYKLHQINMKGLKDHSTQKKKKPQEMGRVGGEGKNSQLVAYSHTQTVTPPQLLGVDISMKRSFPDVLNLPSLTVFSPWLFEWSGRSDTSVWWECECLALRLSISVAVSELPRLVNFPRVNTRNGYLVYTSERCLEARDSNWG